MVLWCHLGTWVGAGTSSRAFFGGSPVPGGPVVVGRDRQGACGFRACSRDEEICCRLNMQSVGFGAFAGSSGFDVVLSLHQLRT